MRPQSKKHMFYRSSMNIQKKYIDAINLIKKEKLITMTAQIELGLRMYLKEHSKLLLKHGINLWDTKK